MDYDAARQAECADILSGERTVELKIQPDIEFAVVGEGTRPVGREEPASREESPISDIWPAKRGRPTSQERTTRPAGRGNPASRE